VALIGTGILGIVALVCAVWVIYDVAANQKNMQTLHKVLWIVFAILFSIITSIVYYFVIKR
jgi:hypothetical protein